VTTEASDGVPLDPAPSAPTARRERLPLWARLALALLALLLANFILRARYEHGADYLRSHMDSAWPGAKAQIYAKPFWRLLLPIPELTGTWSTSYLLVGWLEGSFTSPQIYYALNALFIATTFLLSWFARRSWVFSLTLGLCAAFTTHNYHVYKISGSIALYFPMIYLELVLFSVYKLLTAPAERARLWKGLTLGSLVLLALSYEGWLDFAVYAWIAGAVLAWYYARRGEREQLRRVALVEATLTTFVLVYVLVKVKLGFGQTKGSESDVVFNYPSVWPAIEDVLTNAITFAYTAVVTLFPGSLGASKTLDVLTPEQMIALQHGYHPEAVALIPNHYVFLWRFYAGAVITALLALVVRLARSLREKPEPRSLVFLLLIVLVLTGSPTHAAVKMRPMHCLPFLGYQVWMSVLGLFALVSFWLTTLEDRLRPRIFWVIVGLVWLDVLVCAVTRPHAIDVMAQVGGFGGAGPDPGAAILADVKWVGNETLYRVVMTIKHILHRA
jgi:hypothetical protein